MIYQRIVFLVFAPMLIMLTGCGPDEDELQFLAGSKERVISTAEGNEFSAMSHQYKSYMDQLSEHGRWSKSRIAEVNDELGQILLKKLQTIDPLAASVADEKALATTVSAIDDPELTRELEQFQAKFKDAQAKVSLIKEHYPILIDMTIVDGNMPMTRVMAWKLQSALISQYSKENPAFTFVEQHDAPYATLSVKVQLGFEATNYVDTRTGPMGDSVVIQSATSGKFQVTYDKNLEPYASGRIARFIGEREPEPIITVTNGRINTDYSSEFYEIVVSSKLANDLKLDPSEFLDKLK